MTDDLDLSYGQRLLEQATPGEWNAGEPAWFRGRTDPETGKRPLTAGSEGVFGNIYGKANAELIVWLHNHASALLDIAEECNHLKERNYQLREALERKG